MRRRIRVETPVLLLLEGKEVHAELALAKEEGVAGTARVIL